MIAISRYEEALMVFRIADIGGLGTGGKVREDLQVKNRSGRIQPISPRKR